MGSPEISMTSSSGNLHFLRCILRFGCRCCEVFWLLLVLLAVLVGTEDFYIIFMTFLSLSTVTVHLTAQVRARLCQIERDNGKGICS